MFSSNDPFSKRKNSHDLKEKIFDDFSKWLTKNLPLNTPKEVIAFNFNLYEDNETFHIQLIGASSFSEEDSDWAYDEIFSTKENIFILDKKKDGNKDYPFLKK